MRTDEVPEPYPFPTEALRNYARGLVYEGEPTDVYAAFRSQCDACILTAAPSMPQHKFAKLLGMSRTTLRTMFRRLGLTATDGRRNP